MSFGFSFSVDENGELSQTDQEKQSLKSAIEYNNLKVGTKFQVNGHQPTGPEDWGGSLALTVEGIGTANMSSVFIKKVSE